MSSSRHLVVADDDTDFLRLMTFHLDRWGYRSSIASDKPSLLVLLEQEKPDLVLMDVRFGEYDGLELLGWLRSHRPELGVVMLTAFGSIDSAVSSIQNGAIDYITKPIDLNRLRLTISHALDASAQRPQDQIRAFVQTPSTERPLSRPIVGESRAMVELRSLIDRVAPTDATILIQAESGTGKELVARALHERSQRDKGPFVPLNVASLPRDLAESALFGHEKGAFTGADRVQRGCCEVANRGTLFLDEIGEMDPAIQAKLLRFLQERTVQRIGQSDPISVDVRVVAATHRDLRAMVATGQFREDLYYRLNVVPVAIPPLRDRPEDIELLANSFLKSAASRYGRTLDGFSREAIEAMRCFPWPGNVRQLENLIERVAILCVGPLVELSDLVPEIQGASTQSTINSKVSDEFGFSESPELRPIDRMERDAIEQALRSSNGKVSEAARSLGLSQATIYRKIKKFSIHG
ncbi:sigma-54-dependent transcriptional regulator [Tautonia rosea]|uniref:sigma-54-dependent transcriptional regulator n=1 Tax=Tautonia rosea TaxID=2728037 RepID=UPI00147571E1|nr:sigma-54 dependent transcriptional regulator [Tautonia rosea]